MPNTLHYEAKRNGALALLAHWNGNASAGALATLLALDAYSDEYGNSWATSGNKTEDQPLGRALNIATGFTHKALAGETGPIIWLQKHGAIEQIEGTRRRWMYHGSPDHRTPPARVRLWHVTKWLEPCDDAACKCREYIAGPVPVFYADPIVTPGNNSIVTPGNTKMVRVQDRTVQDEKDAAAGAAAVDEPEPVEEYERPTADELSAMFDVIALRAFNLPRGVSIGNNGGRIGKVRRFTLKADPAARADDLTAFYDWYADAVKISPPRDADKHLERWLEFTAWRDGQSPTGRTSRYKTLSGPGVSNG